MKPFPSPNAALAFGAALLLTALASSATHAAEVADPLADYVASLPVPEGDTVLRLELDLDGDGQNEILLSATSQANAKAGHIWDVYAPEAGGYRHLEGWVNARRDALYVGWVPELEQNAALTYFPAGASLGGIFALRKSAEGIAAEQVLELDMEARPADRDVYERYFGSGPSTQTEEISWEELERRGLIPLAGERASGPQSPPTSETRANASPPTPPSEPRGTSLASGPTSEPVSSESSNVLYAVIAVAAALVALLGALALRWARARGSRTS